MILKGSTTRSRQHAGRLAVHLLNEKDNDRVEVIELSGQQTDDPKKALIRMHGAADLTAGKLGLFQVSINPEEGETMTPAQWEDSIARLEKEFGFEGQARLIVAHTKQGREHIHVVWQRTDYETEKLVSIDDYKRRLTAQAREMEREYGHRQVEDKSLGQSFDQGACRQAKRTGDRSPVERRDFIREAWAQAPNADAFLDQLRAGGYELAQGRKTMVLVHSQTGEIVKGRLSHYLRSPDGAAPKKAELETWASGLTQPLARAEELQKQIQAGQYFDRDRYNIEQQNRIDRAGIEHQEQGGDEGEAEGTGGRQPEYDDSHLRKLDEMREREAREERARYRSEAEMDTYYQRRDLAAEMARKKAELARNQGMRGRVTGRKGELEEEIAALGKTLEYIDQRMSERRGGLEVRIAKERAEKQATPTPGPAPANDQDLKGQAAIEKARSIQALKERARQRENARSRAGHGGLDHEKD